MLPVYNPLVIDRLLQVYLQERVEAESFIETVRRVGHEPFKKHVFATELTVEEEPVADKHAVVPAKYEVPFYSPRF